MTFRIFIFFYFSPGDPLFQKTIEIEKEIQQLNEEWDPIKKIDKANKVHIMWRGIVGDTQLAPKKLVVLFLSRYLSYHASCFVSPLPQKTLYMIF